MQLQSLTLTRPVRAATPAPAPSAPADTAGPSLPRRAVEGLGGVVGASVGALTSAVPAFFAGGFNGVAEMGEKYRPDPQADVMPGEALAGMHATLTAVQLTAAGAITGGLMFGGTGLAVGLVGGLVGGLAVAALQHVGGASQVLGQAINTAGDRAVADNLPSSRKTKDYTRAFTEGSLVGLGQGIRAGGSTGYSQGKGVTSGLLEGIKDGVGTLIGKFDPDTPKPPTPSRGFLHHLIRLPKYALQGATGLVGGAVGMALSTLDGTVQGLVRGVDDREGGSLGLHRGLVLGQSVVAGGVAGGLTFGPMGTAGGLLAGLVSGVVINRIARRSQADQGIVEAITRSVDGARANDPDTGDRIADTFRNAVEGAAVGTVAGARAGFIAGFQGGTGVVDGVWDGLAGIAAAIKEAIFGKK